MRYDTVIKKVMLEHGVKGEVMVDVRFVDEKEMSELHKKYMNLDGPTDVLSFPLDRQKAPDGRVWMGDIIICKPVADRWGESVKFLVEHGCLHLLGVHHD